MAKEALGTILEELNNVGVFFRDTLKGSKIPFNVKDWILISLTYPDFWRFECKKEIKIDIKETYKHTKGIRAYFGINKNNRNIFFRIAIDNYEDLFKKAEHRLNFATRLAKAFLYNKMNISREEYQEILNQSGSFENLNKLVELIETWIKSSNHEKAEELGEQLEKFIPEMPSEALEVPSTTLFRVVKVKSDAFDKLLEEDKPLILKNRKYSSWTYSAEAVEQFAEENLRYKPDEVQVILRKVFKPNEIFINVVSLMEYLLSSDLIPSIENYVQDEKEVIVKNAYNDFTFTLRDIALYQRSGDKNWTKPIKKTTSNFF
jgi:hypothetical protein